MDISEQIREIELELWREIGEERRRERERVREGESKKAGK